jgi:hypothetical protein
LRDDAAGPYATKKPKGIPSSEMTPVPAAAGYRGIGSTD